MKEPRSSIPPEAKLKNKTKKYKNSSPFFHFIYKIFWHCIWDVISNGFQSFVQVRFHQNSSRSPYTCCRVLSAILGQQGRRTLNMDCSSHLPSSQHPSRLISANLPVAAPSMDDHLLPQTRNLQPAKRQLATIKTWCMNDSEHYDQRGTNQSWIFRLGR